MLAYVVMADGELVTTFATMKSAEEALAEAKEQGHFAPGTVLKIQTCRMEKRGSRHYLVPIDGWMDGVIVDENGITEWDHKN
jgi:precorrin-6B methylase 2